MADFSRVPHARSSSDLLITTDIWLSWHVYIIDIYYIQHIYVSVCVRVPKMSLYMKTIFIYIWISRESSMCMALQPHPQGQGLEPIALWGGLGV